MKTKKVTKEEFETLFASCGYTTSDIWEGKHFYFVNIKEQEINVEDIKLLQIEGLELYSIGVGVFGGVEIDYYKG